MRPRTLSASNSRLITHFASCVARRHRCTRSTSVIISAASRAASRICGSWGEGPRRASVRSRMHSMTPRGFNSANKRAAGRRTRRRSRTRAGGPPAGGVGRSRLMDVPHLTYFHYSCVQAMVATRTAPRRDPPEWRTLHQVRRVGSEREGVGDLTTHRGPKPARGRRPRAAVISVIFARNSNSPDCNLKLYLIRFSADSRGRHADRSAGLRLLPVGGSARADICREHKWLAGWLSSLETETIATECTDFCRPRNARYVVTSGPARRIPGYRPNFLAFHDAS